MPGVNSAGTGIGIDARALGGAAAAGGVAGASLSDTLLTDSNGVLFVARDNGTTITYLRLDTNTAYTPVGTIQDPGRASSGSGATGITMPAGGSGLQGWLSGIYSKVSNALAVTGTFWQATQPVSAASLPLPTGAAADGTDSSSVTQLSGGAGIRGWLSGIFSKLSGTISVAGVRSNDGTGVVAGTTHVSVGGSDGVNLRPLLTDTSGRAVVTVNVSALPTGAATQASLASVDGKLPALSNARLPVETVFASLVLTDRSGATSGAVSTATSLIGANPTRHGFSLYNPHATATVWFSDVGTAAATSPSRPLLPGGYYESPPGGQGVAAISILSTVASVPVSAREW